jgi:hypothetical protein
MVTAYTSAPVTSNCESVIKIFIVFYISTRECLAITISRAIKKFSDRSTLKGLSAS